MLFSGPARKKNQFFSISCLLESMFCNQRMVDQAIHCIQTAVSTGHPQFLSLRPVWVRRFDKAEPESHLLNLLSRRLEDEA